MTPEAKSQAIAAGVILVAAILVIYFLPTIVIGIGQYSPILGFVVGTLLLLGFFAVFWLRARYQKNRRGE